MFRWTILPVFQMNTKNNEFTNFKKAIFQLEVWFFNVEMWKSELAKKIKRRIFLFVI